MKVTANILVNNEENFIWFVIQSIINHVDEIMVWDDGSIDKTKELIKLIKSKKVILEERSLVKKESFSDLRQEMINRTMADWILVTDGDEIWYNDTLDEARKLIDTNKYEAIVTPVKMLIGDFYHYQPENAGKYNIKNKTGHYNIRFVKNAPDLKILGDYSVEAYARGNVKVQYLDNIVFQKNPYLHASHLKRSSAKRDKFKHEIGIPFDKDFFYPEAMFNEVPNEVPNPWYEMNSKYKLISKLETPLKKIKRKLT